MKRLDTVLSLIDKCAVLADIGCDHGKLALYAAAGGSADFVYAADISEKSLLKAKVLLKDCKNVQCVVSDGFNSLEKLPDTAVITGLGGREIVRIISGYNVKTLILGPQNHAAFLRKALCAEGYKITDDKIAIENNKFYDIIKAVYTNEKHEIGEAAAQWGNYYKIKSPVLKLKLEITEKKLLTYKRTRENEEKLKIIQEVKLCQQ